MNGGSLSFSANQLVRNSMGNAINKSDPDGWMAVVQKEGFRELTEKEIKKEPYKSIAKAPLCFKKAK